jgi:hypothetical protein
MSTLAYQPAHRPAAFPTRGSLVPRRGVVARGGCAPAPRPRVRLGRLDKWHEDAHSRRTVGARFFGPFKKKDATTVVEPAPDVAPEPTPEPEDTSASFDLLDLRSGAPDALAVAAQAWERVDDVVMGGVSSSAIGPDLAGRDCLVWAGKCRIQGGGFAGCRSVALKNQIDLSAFDGVSIVCGLESDDEPTRRTWKATVRTQNNRGEVVYQASFVPPVADKDVNSMPPEVRIPWESFRLVRGPVVVPDVPPLSADQCTAVYGLGLIMSRFGPSGPMPTFREGPFRLALHQYGVYTADGKDAATAPTTLPAAANLGDKSSENSGRTKNSPISVVLGPLIKLVFSEKARRRRRAREILKERYRIGEIRARCNGQRMKAARMGYLGATAEGLGELARDAVASVLTLPLRGLFILISRFARLVRTLKGEKQLPPMK